MFYQSLSWPKSAICVFPMLIIQKRLNFWSTQWPGVAENLPMMQETWLWSLDGKTSWRRNGKLHSNILVWRIPQTEDPGGL